MTAVQSTRSAPSGALFFCAAASRNVFEPEPDVNAAEESNEAPPIRPFSVDDVPWEPWSEGVRFGGRVKRLGALAGGTRVGVLIDELPPGRQSVPFHWHTQEEEHLWFLAGRATLRLGTETYPVVAGDYVCFPAGRAMGHCLVNDGDETCCYLVVGTRSPDDVCFYPDSDKVMIRGERMILSTADPRAYWAGERSDEPLPAGEKKAD